MQLVCKHSSGHIELNTTQDYKKTKHGYFTACSAGIQRSPIVRQAASFISKISALITSKDLILDDIKAATDGLGVSQEQTDSLQHLLATSSSLILSDLDKARNIANDLHTEMALCNDLKTAVLMGAFCNTSVTQGDFENYQEPVRFLGRHW